MNQEKAEQIVNDIAEDIDNGESREELREALAMYADKLITQNREFAEKKARGVIKMIMRICPDCGEDMGGDEHRTCYKCYADKMAKAILAGKMNYAEMYKSAIEYQESDKTVT